MGLVVIVIAWSNGSDEASVGCGDAHAMSVMIGDFL